MKNLFRMLEELWVVAAFAEAGVIITVTDDDANQFVQSETCARMS